MRVASPDLAMALVVVFEHLRLFIIVGMKKRQSEKDASSNHLFLLILMSLG